MNLKSSSCCNKIKEGSEKGQTSDIQTNIENTFAKISLFISVHYFFAIVLFIFAIVLFIFAPL